VSNNASRKLDPKTKARSRARPAQHARSTDGELNLAKAIRSRFRHLGGVELRIPPRGVALVDPWKP
jgi:plasmid stability protein